MGYIPTKTTLSKYGLTLSEWENLLISQGGKCAICKKEAKIFHIDHEHIRGWKSLLPEKKRLYVRGLLCWYCNRWYMSRNMTIEKAGNIQNYLLEYERLRKN